VLEIVISWVVLLHAVLGGVALLSGLIAILAPKGRIVHTASGKLFFASMLISGLSAMIVSWLPEHENLFLFVIGIFSLYFLVTGYRAVRFKVKSANFTDRIVSLVMLFTGIFMIIYPMVSFGVINLVLASFGSVGILFASRDLMLYRKPGVLKKNWLKLHLGKMMGAYISAFTAFVVVNQILPGIYGWLLPGVIGGVVIALWIRRVSS
jgi:uncharacterized membrane protein